MSRNRPQEHPFSIDNSELLATAQLSKDDGKVLATQPHTRGIGFSARLEYPMQVRERITENISQPIFAFLKLSAYTPKDGVSEEHLLAILTIDAARVPEGKDDTGSVVALPSLNFQAPMSLTETGYLSIREGKTLFMFDERQGWVPLAEVVRDIWRDHVSSFDPFYGFVLRVQNSVRELVAKRYLPLIGLVEKTVWIFSGDRFEQESPPKVDDQTSSSDEDFFGVAKASRKIKGESIGAWLARSTPIQSLSSTDSPTYSADLTPKVGHEEVTFHGIKVSPVSMLWFYIIIGGVYLYYFLSSKLGLVAFLKDYWTAILFLAPLFLLVLSWLIPEVGKLLLNRWISRHFAIHSKFPRTRRLKRLLGFYYFGRHCKLEYDSDNFE